MAQGEPTVRTTAIPGLLVVDLVVHEDDRGWFKENWQRAKMTAGGLPDFHPVQHSVAFNEYTGVTRGLHAEPWDKLVSVASGRVFGAWVDLRPGRTFGTVVTYEIGPATAVFVPRGVANGYQSLAAGTVYSYLVNDHWKPEARDRYAYVNLADESLGINWPIAVEQAIISEADRAHPRLEDARPAVPRQTVILGAGGQLGQALAPLFPDAVLLARDHLDLTVSEQVGAFDWGSTGTIINASAFTAVDAAETPSGRRDAWALNTAGVARLCRIADRHRATLVHVSSDYVFDGAAPEHDEDEPFSPLGVYGASKAAGDTLVGQLPQHFLVRTSWLVGDGANFVATMADLARRGISPTVVDDQYGRLTFAADLAAGIAHLLSTGAPFGTYNLSNSGPVQSWADIAGDVFELCGRSRHDVTPITTAEYAAGLPDRSLAPRPRHSTLALDKITAAGYRPPPAADRLVGWIASHEKGSAPNTT